MTSPEHIAFETMYLEFPPSSSPRSVSAADVLAYMNTLGLIAVGIEGSAYGVDTAVIAKVAVTTHNEESVVLVADAQGDIRPGPFTGSVCQQLARGLDTELIADEYVRYAPGQPDEAVDFVELDPRRQAIDHPAGFPNEWRLSPARLSLKAIAFSESNTETAAQLIARESDVAVESISCATGRIIKMPAGVAQLPQATNVSPRRTVLMAQGGQAKYALLQVGSGKKQLNLSIANLPAFRAIAPFPSGSPAAEIVHLLQRGALVPGTVATNHAQFPQQYGETAATATLPEGADNFFTTVSQLFGAPAEAAQLMDDTQEFPTGPDHRVTAPNTNEAALVGAEVLSEPTGNGVVARIARYLYTRPWLRLTIGALWLLAGISTLSNAHLLGQTILPQWLVWASGILFLLQGISESLQAILHLILRRRSVPKKG